MVLGGSLGIAALVTLGLLGSPPSVLGGTAATPPDSARTDSIAATPADGSWSIAVFAQADGKGELHPCHCPGSTSTALGLRATVFRKGQSLGMPALILDGGDFTADPEDPLREERAALFVEAMHQLPYDAVAVGERELGLGREVLARAAAQLPLVCANLEGGEDLGIPKLRRVVRDGKRILVTSYLDPALAPAPGTGPDAWRVTDPGTAISGVLRQSGGEFDLLVLLAHASTAGTRDMILAIPQVDVAIRGHEPEEGPYLQMVGRVPLLLPEAHSRNVVQVVLNLAGDGTLASRRGRSWELKQIENGDPRLDALVRDFEAKHGLEE